MTHRHRRPLQVLAALSVLVATAAVAEPSPASIMLEQIGAVRMATPDEIRQQQASAPSRDDRGQQQTFR